MAQRSGLVTDFVLPKPTDQKTSCMVGGRKVWMFVQSFDKTAPSDAYSALLGAFENQLSVTAEGDEYTSPGKSSPMFTAKTVLAGPQTPQNGSQGSSGGSGATQTTSAYSDDRQKIISRQWSLNFSLASFGGQVSDEELQAVVTRAKNFYGLVQDEEQWS